MSKSQTTYSEFNSSINQNLWVCTLFGFCFVFPWFMLPFAFPGMRVRAFMRFNLRWLVEQIDPECAHMVLAGEVHRILKEMPRSHRKQLKDVATELNTTARGWSELQTKLDRLRAFLPTISLNDLEITRRDLTARISRETDSVTLASLQRQLEAVEGQAQAARDAAVWQNRLTAAQSECTQSLIHLRSQLALMAATDDMEHTTAVTEAVAALNTINMELTAAHNATEGCESASPRVSGLESCLDHVPQFGERLRIDSRAEFHFSLPGSRTVPPRHISTMLA